jgi:protein-S-isoprenylcysteine O-methyltransferase Ste14
MMPAMRDNILGWLAVVFLVLVAMVGLGALIWRGIDMSERVDLQQQKTQQTRIAACQNSDNVTLCIEKTQP